MVVCDEILTHNTIHFMVSLIYGLTRRISCNKPLRTVVLGVLLPDLKKNLMLCRCFVVFWIIALGLDFILPWTCLSNLIAIFGIVFVKSISKYNSAIYECSICSKESWSVRLVDFDRETELIYCKDLESQFFRKNERMKETMTYNIYYRKNSYFFKCNSPISIKSGTHDQKSTKRGDWKSYVLTVVSWEQKNRFLHNSLQH